MNRQIPRDESNFVFVSHGLIVELEHMAWWFWNAPEHHHGTTQNTLGLLYPDTYQKFMTLPEYNQLAQWTRAFVMPRAVTDAVRRADKRRKGEYSVIVSCSCTDPNVENE